MPDISPIGRGYPFRSRIALKAASDAVPFVGTVITTEPVEQNQNLSDQHWAIQIFQNMTVAAVADTAEVILVGSQDGVYWQRIAELTPLQVGAGVALQAVQNVQLEMKPRFIAVMGRLGGTAQAALEVWLMSDDNFAVGVDATGLVPALTWVAAGSAAGSVGAQQGRVALANPFNQVAVVLPSAYANANTYGVSLTLQDTDGSIGAGSTIWFDTKLVTGFTAHVGGAAPVGDDWTINWRTVADGL